MSPLPSTYVGSNRIVNRRGRRLNTAQIMRQTFTNVRTIDTDGYSASHVGQSAAGTVDMTLGGANCTSGVGIADIARNVVITVTHASAVVAMSGTIYGTDVYGKAITEAWSVSAGGTSQTFTGKKAFKTVTRITETIAADASTNTVIVGDGKVLGLDAYCSIASAVKEIADGSVVTNGTIVAASSASTDDARGTYAPNATPDGSKDFTIYFLSDSPEAYD